jgi:hypothetical protein
MLQDRSSRINCLGIYVIIDERIVVQGDGASDIAGMSDHSLKLPFEKRDSTSALGRTQAFNKVFNRGRIYQVSPDLVWFTILLANYGEHVP